MPLAESHHVVVDGSNLATEGRTFPSLGQLDEAVRAYAAEDPAASIIVVVDATFEHRVAEPEREEVRQAMLNGEVISPPAGAIGRGDAFVLRIAERTGATVLSNDSFQEFHGEHPWLFDDGRLIGGKPVPGVGWIFTPRLPYPRTQEPGGDGRGESEEGPRVRAREGGGAGQGGQAGGEQAVQGPAHQEEGDTGRLLVASHAHRSTPGSGQGQSGVLERDRRSGRGSAASATTREVAGCRQQARCSQEGCAAAEGKGQEGHDVAQSGHRSGWTPQGGECGGTGPGPVPEETVGAAPRGQRATGFHQLRRRVHGREHH